MAAVDNSDNHKVYIHNVERKVTLYITDGSKEATLDVRWSQRPDDLRFVTVAAKELKFWHPADVTKKI